MAADAGMDTRVRGAFDAFCASPDGADRVDAFLKLLGALRLDAGGAWKAGPLAGFLDALEGSSQDRARFGAALAGVLDEVDATNLLGSSGIPGHRGFFSEAGDRLAARLLPVPRDDRDLARLASRVYTSERNVAHVRDMPLDLFHRLVRLFEQAPPDRSWDTLRATFADGFRLLLTRVGAEGLSPKLRARGTASPVSSSPFHRIGAAGEALMDAWIAGVDVTDAARRLRKVSGACRKEARVIQQHLERAGVSVDIVFSLEVIDRCLTRIALMTDVCDAAPGPRRSQAIQRLLARVFVSARQDLSLWHLTAWNLHLLVRKIVDRSGETGDHYIAKDRREYRHIWLAAAGGGALTVGTAVVKMAIHGWHLPAGPEGLLYGLNYAVSFLLLQRFGLILATKQPAMTAATLAGIIRESAGEDREDRIASTFARLTSSQFAAAVGNVLVVSSGALLVGTLFPLATGTAYLPQEEAVATLRSLSPIDSMTVVYSIMTGVVLWLASVAGGWFDNWCVYHRIADGIAQHPFGKIAGRTGLVRLARSISRNASGWGTNVSLGFMLGMMPALGRFTGLPIDVRHVTLNSGILALAASGVEWASDAHWWILRAVLGIATMFVLNLSVSFACSLVSAARAYEVSNDDLYGILKSMGRRFLRSPLEFVRRPPANPHGGHA